MQNYYNEKTVNILRILLMYAKEDVLKSIIDKFLFGLNKIPLDKQSTRTIFLYYLLKTPNDKESEESKRLHFFIHFLDILLSHLRIMGVLKNKLSDKKLAELLSKCILYIIKENYFWGIEKHGLLGTEIVHYALFFDKYNYKACASIIKKYKITQDGKALNVIVDERKINIKHFRTLSSLKNIKSFAGYKQFQVASSEALREVSVYCPWCNPIIELKNTTKPRRCDKCNKILRYLCGNNKAEAKKLNDRIIKTASLENRKLKLLKMLRNINTKKISSQEEIIQNLIVAQFSE